MRWLLARLREPSTWRGLIWLAAAAGLSLRPDQAEAIVAAGMALAGLLGVFLSEAKPTKIELPPIDLQARPESGDAALGLGAMQPADQLRQPVSPDRRPGAVDPNPSPRFGSGFGDRD